MEPRLYFADVQYADIAPIPEPEEFFEFRGKVRVFPKPETEVNGTLLEQREGYATIFTDPYGYLWTMSTAQLLTDQDFARAGVFLSSKTEDNHTFYYGKVNTWEIQADCVVYLAAGNKAFVNLRRNQDQGPCPTAAGYAEWLPRAESPEAKAEPDQKFGSLFAYGANNHKDNIIHGVFEEVEAYGNDVYGQPCNDFRLLSDCMAYAGNSHTGAKWDSAEFVSRYLITRRNHSPVWHGPAKYWYKNGYGMFRMSNCGSVRPQIGDMMVSEGGSHGHAAIVREVGDHSVTVIQQNWFESPKDNSYTLFMSNSGNDYCVSDFGDGYPVIGWLRESNLK